MINNSNYNNTSYWWIIVNYHEHMGYSNYNNNS